MNFQILSRPFKFNDEHLKISKFSCESSLPKIETAFEYSLTVKSADFSKEPSALFTIITSANSIIPYFIPCSSSPPAGNKSTRKMSTISQTVVSA